MRKQTLLTPVELSATTKVGPRLFKKQILPLGSIDYMGRKIVFDKKYLTDLSKSFKQRAYDQVPLILADPENRHNMDPERFAGEITDFTVEADGLYATVKPGKRANKILKDNPKLGVSARIVEGLSKSDGRSFPRAIQHVLLTMDPRVTGLKPWQTVSLSEDSATTHRTVDLTGCIINKESAMPKKTPARTQTSQGRRARIVGDKLEIDLATLSDEELALLSLSVPGGDDEDGNDDTDSDQTSRSAGTDDDDTDEDDDDEDFEVRDGIVADDTTDERPIDDPIVETPIVKSKKDLSNGKKGKKRQIDLTNSASIDLAEVRNELARERWGRLRDSYEREGVPPFLLDLATPILSSPDPTVLDLSTSDEPVDASAVIREILDGIKGMVDLSSEMGHNVLPDESEQEKVLLDAWDKEYGIR